MPKPRSWRLISVSCNSVVVFELIFRSVIHLGFIFIYRSEVEVQLVEIQFSKHHLLRLFLHWMYLTSLSKIQWTQIKGSLPLFSEVSLLMFLNFIVIWHLEFIFIQGSHKSMRLCTFSFYTKIIKHDSMFLLERDFSG